MVLSSPSSRNLDFSDALTEFYSRAHVVSSCEYSHFGIQNRTKTFQFRFLMSEVNNYFVKFDKNFIQKQKQFY